MLIRENDIVVRRQGIISSAIQGEILLLSLQTNNYYGMDEIASRVWMLMEQPIRVADLIDVLLEEYDIERTECLSDVCVFLSNMEEEGIILRIDEKPL